MINSPRPTVVTVPGLDNSGPGHWQTLLEQSDPGVARFEPSSWDKPQLDDWLAALDRAVAAAADAPLLVAHSLGTLTVAHWAARSSVRVAGALLVAMPDPDDPPFEGFAPTFRNVPRTPLPFRSIVVASTTDPYDPAHVARGYAEAWGSEFVDAGDAGHLNIASGHGPWPLGTELINRLRAS